MGGMDLTSNVKQEHSVLQGVPPPIHHPLPPSTHNPAFSLSASPPQQSPMFMQPIHSNAQRPVYPTADFTMGSGNAGNALLSRSQNGPPPRPSNLPPLRRRTSSSSNSNANNTMNTKSQDLRQMHSNHVLTPFDYPLSNPIITNDGGVNHESHGYYTRYNTKIKEEKNTHSDSKGGPVKKRNLNHSIHSAPLYSVHALSNGRGSTAQSASATPTPQQQAQHFSLSTALLQIPQHQRPARSFVGHFNFLWWYPEIKFCELDPQAVPLP